MQQATFAIGDVPQKVLGPAAGGALVQADAANSTDIYLGAQSVTADATGTGGIRLAPGVMLPLVIAGNEPLWAITAVGGQILRTIVGTDVDALELG